MPYSDAERSDQLEDVLIVAHSMMGTVYSLGCFLHARRKSWDHAAVHSVGLVYHAWSVWEHVNFRSE